MSAKSLITENRKLITILVGGNSDSQCLNLYSNINIPFSLKLTFMVAISRETAGSLGTSCRSHDVRLRQVLIDEFTRDFAFM